VRRRSCRLFRALRAFCNRRLRVYNIDSLADCEAYRQLLATDPAGRSNYEFARREQVIRKEERIFLKPESTPYAAPV